MSSQTFTIQFTIVGYSFNQCKSRFPGDECSGKSILIHVDRHTGNVLYYLHLGSKICTFLEPNLKVKIYQKKKEVWYNTYAKCIPTKEF